MAFCAEVRRRLKFIFFSEYSGQASNWMWAFFFSSNNEEIRESLTSNQSCLFLLAWPIMVSADVSYSVAFRES